MTNVVKEIETVEVSEIALPQEVQSLALLVAPDKKEEVQTVLTQIFTGTSDWSNQVDAIHVKDVNDLMSITMADSARLNIKKARLAAEKIFDAKRAEVQQKMADFKTEDALWLKAKQVMVITFKAIEEKAEWKARYIERHEAEQKALRTEIRITKVRVFNPEITSAEIESMTDDSFNAFLSGIEKVHNEKIEAAKKIEEERIAKEKAEAAERLRIEQENARLKAEAELKEKALAEERAKVAAEQKAAEEKARKEREAVEAKAKAEREASEKILREQRIANEKLQAEIKTKELQAAKEKQEAELKRAAEEKAQKLADKKAAAAPDKIKLERLAIAIDELEMPMIKNPEADQILSDAKGLLTKVSKFIRSKSEEL
jgi:hypothetical protein